MRISFRLNDQKDSDIVNILKNIPETYRSEATRKALRQFFNLPERIETNPLTIFLTPGPETSTIKELPSELPVLPPKETQRETTPMKELPKEKVSENNDNDLRAAFRRRTARRF